MAATPKPLPPLTIVDQWGDYDERMVFPGVGKPVTVIIHHELDEDQQEALIKEIDRALKLVVGRPHVSKQRIAYWQEKRLELLEAIATRP